MSFCISLWETKIRNNRQTTRHRSDFSAPKPDRRAGQKCNGERSDKYADTHYLRQCGGAKTNGSNSFRHKVSGKHIFQTAGPPTPRPLSQHRINGIGKLRWGPSIAQQTGIPETEITAAGNHHVIEQVNIEQGCRSNDSFGKSPVLRTGFSRTRGMIVHQHQSRGK